MNIQWTHENRYVNSAVSKVLVSLDLFNSYNFSVGRRHDDIVINCVFTFWDTKEGNNEYHQHERDKKDQPAYCRSIKTKNVKRKDVHCGKQNDAPCDDLITFLMNGHLRVLRSKYTEMGSGQSGVGSRESGVEFYVMKK